MRRQLAESEAVVEQQAEEIGKIKERQDAREIKLLQKFCLVLNAKKQKIKTLMEGRRSLSEESGSATSEKVLDQI